jgi:hypothetical protein
LGASELGGRGAEHEPCWREPANWMRESRGRFCRRFTRVVLDSGAAIALIVGSVAIGIKSLAFLARKMAESQKLIHNICSSISITDTGVGARDEPPMSLEPGMITDGRVAGARSVPGCRSPSVLTCARLGRDIALGAAGRSVGATVPALVGGYRLNSDQVRDSECGPFTLVHGCWKPAPKRHFPPLSAMCSTIASGRVIPCKFNGRHRMGTARGELRRWRTRVARVTKSATTNRWLCSL